MTEQPGASRQPGSPPPGFGATAGAGRRWQEFVAVVGQHAYDREQAAALLQLAVELVDESRGRASLRLEWRNIYAAVATLTRTDSETLHARLTVGFSPAEFKWMLQNKALYTWHSQPVRFQRCLQCMVAKLGTTNAFVFASSTSKLLRHCCALSLRPEALFAAAVGSQYKAVCHNSVFCICRSVWQQRRKNALVMSKQANRCTSRSGCQ